MKKLLALLALSLIAHAAQAQTTNSASGNTTAEQRRDRFQLWTDCAPVYLSVERLGQDAIDIGLTVESLETLVRSRLRSARIYSDTREGIMLYLNVNVVGVAFSNRLSLDKRITDNFFSSISGFAPVWYRASTGTHGEDAGYIRQSISRKADEFIDEYLRVNAESCGGPGVSDNSN